MNFRLPLSLILALATSPALAQHGASGQSLNTFFEEKLPWSEANTELPPFPKDAGLVEIYVGPAATNTYLIDVNSLSVGTDDVVRYSLVVRAAGGAQNVSYEGIHCKDRNWKLYATGHIDGTWSKARISQWRPIENKPMNRHHAALSRDYFCPNGVQIRVAEEGRDALRRGKHPDSDRGYH